MADDDKTPARRPSAIRIEKWLMVDDWLVQNERRWFLGRIHPKLGKQIVVMNERGIEAVVTMTLEEDVSSAILRAIQQL